MLQVSWLRVGCGRRCSCAALAEQLSSAGAVALKRLESAVALDGADRRGRGCGTRCGRGSAHSLSEEADVGGLGVVVHA